LDNYFFNDYDTNDHNAKKKKRIEGLPENLSNIDLAFSDLDYILWKYFKINTYDIFPTKFQVSISVNVFSLPLSAFITCLFTVLFVVFVTFPCHFIYSFWRWIWGQALIINQLESEGANETGI